MSTKAILALADGSIFRGRSIGAEGMRCGELVFNTSMTGYQEIITDPSYAGQIITFTYPHIGNVGVNRLDVESTAIHAAGVVIRDYPNWFSSWRSEASLGEFLKKNGLIGISDIDTRELTRRLRTHGSQNACLMAGKTDETAAVVAAAAHPSMSGQALAHRIGLQESKPYGQFGVWDSKTDDYPVVNRGLHHVVAYDFGIKTNILRILANHGCRVTLVPADTSAQVALAMNPDGIFLSNGPGDPEPLTHAIEAIKVFIERKIPVFGICLGHQLLGLASGAKTVKMKFGHHGANHPVQNLASGRVMITSQNHGFAVDEQTLPSNVRATHRSLFDGSLQGLAFTDRPIFAFQGHPEAGPGPYDAENLFVRFTEAMQQHKAA